MRMLLTFAPWGVMATSQMRTVLSPDPETMYLPSGVRVTLLTEDVCPFKQAISFAVDDELLMT